MKTDTGNAQLLQKYSSKKLGLFLGNSSLSRMVIVVGKTLIMTENGVGTSNSYKKDMEMNHLSLPCRFAFSTPEAPAAPAAPAHQRWSQSKDSCEARHFKMTARCADENSRCGER